MFHCSLRAPEQVCDIWESLHWERWGRLDGEVGSWLFGLPLHGSTAGCDCLNPLLFLCISFSVPPSAGYPKSLQGPGNLSNSSLWHLRDSMSPSEKDHGALCSACALLQCSELTLSDGKTRACGVQAQGCEGRMKLLIRVWCEKRNVIEISMLVCHSSSIVACLSID